MTDTTHYEWLGMLYCENEQSSFEWESEDPLTAPDQCPHCGEELNHE